MEREIVFIVLARLKWKTTCKTLLIISDKVNSVASRWRPGENIMIFIGSSFSLKLVCERIGIFPFRRNIVYWSSNIVFVDEWLAGRQEVAPRSVSVEEAEIIGELYKSLPDIIKAIDMNKRCQDLGISDFFCLQVNS